MISIAAKYSGCGNDFLVVDGRNHPFPYEDQASIVFLCHRLQSDGILVLEDSEKADYRMRLFNADGSEADMCGNGLRCLAAFASLSGTIETNHYIHETNIDGDFVTTTMAPPHSIHWNQALEGHTFHQLNTGVPHIVLFVDDVDTFPLQEVGPYLRYHERFAPEGTNVNIVHFKKNDLFIRTWERGVERETLACGTGSTAAALAAARIYGLPSPILVHVKGGHTLKIAFNDDFSEVTQAGPTEKMDIPAAS